MFIFTFDGLVVAVPVLSGSDVGDVSFSSAPLGLPQEEALVLGAARYVLPIVAEIKEKEKNK